MCENLVEQVDELLGQMNIDELTQVIKNAEQSIICLNNFTNSKIKVKTHDLFRKMVEDVYPDWVFEDYTITTKCGSYKEDFKKTIVYEISIYDKKYENYHKFVYWVNKYDCLEYEYYIKEKLIDGREFKFLNDNCIFDDTKALQIIGFIYNNFQD